MKTKRFLEKLKGILKQVENNLVELKLYRINRYFEKFKTKYKLHYELNKTNKTHLVLPYQKLVMPAIFSFIGIITFLMTRIIYWQISNSSSSMTLSSFNKAAMLLINILSIVLLGVLSLLIVTYLIDFFKNIHKETIEYTKKEYYNKIKSIMIEQIQSELSNLITEDTLAFDIDGLIIAPNLNTNENIKLFKEIERSLKLNEQQSH